MNEYSYWDPTPEEAAAEAARAHLAEMALREERILANELRGALNDCCVVLIDAGISPPPQAHRALTHHREVRGG